MILRNAAVSEAILIGLVVVTACSPLHGPIELRPASRDEISTYLADLVPTDGSRAQSRFILQSRDTIDSLSVTRQQQFHVQACVGRNSITKLRELYALVGEVPQDVLWGTFLGESACEVTQSFTFGSVGEASEFLRDALNVLEIAEFYYGFASQE